jgi:hypothetical protein
VTPLLKTEPTSQPEPASATSHDKDNQSPLPSYDDDITNPTSFIRLMSAEFARMSMHVSSLHSCPDTCGYNSDTFNSTFFCFVDACAGACLASGVHTVLFTSLMYSSLAV